MSFSVVINCLGLFLLFCLPLSAFNSPDAPRVALVIGNGAYSMKPLFKTVADADAIRNFLREAGFKVIYATDLGQEEMREKVRAFKEALTPRAVGVFYFSGHGVQMRGENFLMPIDSNPGKPDDVVEQWLSLGQIVGAMDEAETGMNVVILDACRNDPFPIDSSLSNGLAQTRYGAGTLLAYATGPGEYAVEYDAMANGLYTHHLLKNLGKPGVHVERAFKLTARDVLAASNKRQRPWYHNSIVDDFSFIPGDPPGYVPEPNAFLAVQRSLRGMGGKINLRDARNQARAWSAKGDPLGIMWHARLVQKGWCGVSKNPQKALELTRPIFPKIQAASARNQPEAIFFEAFIYDEGIGVPKDLPKAVAKYRIAAEAGLAEAQYNLANMFEYGDGVAQSYEQAYRWYEAAATQGHAPARTALGLLHEEGLSRSTSIETARAYYLKAAQQGDARAQFNLALLMEKGWGGPRDQSKAITWYRKAAEQNDDRARVLLGSFYLEGNGVAQSWERAASWFADAASLGNADAQYHLGMMHLNKQLVDASPSRARQLLEAAARQSHQPAARALERLK